MDWVSEFLLFDWFQSRGGTGRMNLGQSKRSKQIVSILLIKSRDELEADHPHIISKGKKWPQTKMYTTLTPFSSTDFLPRKIEPMKCLIVSLTRKWFLGLRAKKITLGMWKVITFFARNRCQKSCTFLFEATCAFGKMFPWYFSFIEWTDIRFQKAQIWLCH